MKHSGPGLKDEEEERDPLVGTVWAVSYICKRSFVEHLSSRTFGDGGVQGFSIAGTVSPCCCVLFSCCVIIVMTRRVDVQCVMYLARPSSYLIDH
jgi:hypothetical protein